MSKTIGYGAAALAAVLALGIAGSFVQTPAASAAADPLLAQAPAQGGPGAPAGEQRRRQRARTEEEPTTGPAARYGYLGLSPAPVPPRLARQLELRDGRGVRVVAVRPDGPADKAGIRENDVITQLNDQVIYSAIQFAKLVAAQQPDQMVRLSIIRETRPETLNVQVGSTSRQTWREMQDRGPMRPRMRGGPMRGGPMRGRDDRGWGGRGWDDRRWDDRGMSPRRGPRMGRMMWAPRELLRELEPLRAEMPAATWEKLKAIVESKGAPATRPRAP